VRSEAHANIPREYLDHSRFPGGIFRLPCRGSAAGMSPAWPGEQAADGILALVRLLPVALHFHGSEYSTGIGQESRNGWHGKRNDRPAVEPDDRRHRLVLGDG